MTPVVARGASGTPPFRHEALPYDGEDRFVDAVLPFLQAGVDAGEPALVVVSPGKIRALQAALGSTACVTYADMHAVGGNPACLVPVWRDFVDEHAGEGTRLRGVGEPVWPGRSPEERSEWIRHEALLNVAFADTTGWTLVCPYDTTTLDGDVRRQMWQTHPYVRTPTDTVPSPRYEAVDAPEDLDAVLGEPLPAPPADAAEVAFTPTSLDAVRRTVMDHARRWGLPQLRVNDLLVAVNEAATNSLTHGGGQGRVRLWSDERAVVCEIRDRGTILSPLTGRVRPRTDEPGGRGLWLVNHLCDLVQLRSTDARTVVRLHMWRDDTPT